MLLPQFLKDFAGEGAFRASYQQTAPWLRGARRQINLVVVGSKYAGGR
jgi:hypothetical protein